MARTTNGIVTILASGLLMCVSGADAQTLKNGVHLTASICKTNCQYYGAPGNCQNIPDKIIDGREVNSQLVVAYGNITNSTTIHINGRLLARADTCNKNAELRIKFTPDGGGGTVLETVVSTCGPTMLTTTGINKAINLSRQTSGSIEFTLMNGDWCSSVDGLVFTTN